MSRSSAEKMNRCMARSPESYFAAGVQIELNSYASSDTIFTFPPFADALTVVFQTASTGYLEDERYDLLRASLEDAGADGRPLAWVSTRRDEERQSPSHDYMELEVRIWPSPVRLAALVDHHGRWLDWVG